MKIKYGIISILIICIFTPACQYKVENNLQTEATNFDMKAASNVVEAYMHYLVKGDMENIQKLYSKNIKNSPVKTENNKLKIFGYNLLDSSQVGNSGMFIMNVSRTSVEKTFACLDQYSIKVTKEENNYKISQTNNISQKEAFIYKNKIRMKNKDSGDLNLIMSLRSFPYYVFSKDDKANINKVEIPRKRFGIMNFSYDGNFLAVTTIDNNCYIGIINIDNSLAVQGGTDSGQDQGSDDGSGSSGEQDQEGNILEKPIGKEIISLDLLKNSSVDFMSFSKDQKFLAIQYSNDTVGSCIRLYKTDGGNMADYKFEEKFPMDKVNVVFSSFDEDTLNFDVISKKSRNNSVSNIEGKWQLNLKNFKAVRM